MAWPIASDYQEAVQNPSLAFCDPELQGGKPTLTKLGLPKPITGAFASVYEFQCAKRRVAVRCFLHEFADQQRRYDAISKHLKSTELACCVDFDFLAQGIRLQGRWYPILKMEWIDGEPLNRYVERILQRPSALNRLARDWLRLLTTLRNAKIAHGDLQHGNILVSQSQLRLIDYDGMYVPALHGAQSHEQGHRNYQHPSRDGSDFDLWIDNFSGWVIFYSLTALSIEPNLWHLLNAGDECLLFRRHDFEAPQESKVFQALDSSGRSELQSFASHLRLLLSCPLSQIPALDQGSPVGSHPTQHAAQGPPSKLPAWLDAASERPAPASNIRVDATSSAIVGASWIIDHLVEARPPIPAFAGANFTLERMVLLIAAIFTMTYWAAALAAASSFISSTAWLATASAATIVVAFFRDRYRSRSSDVGKEKRAARHRLAESRKELWRVEQAIKAADTQSAEIQAPYRKLNAEYRGLQARLNAQIQGLRRDYQQSVARIDGEEQKLQSRLQSALHGAKRTFQDQRDRIQAQLLKASFDEQHELANLRITVRDQHIQKTLLAATIAEATLEGIGPSLKDRLAAAGYRTAADVNSGVFRVFGIGPVKAAALAEWRRIIALHTASSSQCTPSQSDIAAIQQKYANLRSSLMLACQQVDSAELNEEHRIKAQFAPDSGRLAAQRNDAKRRHDQLCAAATEASAKRQREIEDHFKSTQDTANAQVRQLSRRSKALRRELFGKQLEFSRAERELARYQNITVLGFVARVLNVRRSGRRA